MANVVKSIGKLFGVKEPKPDEGVALMQQREMAQTKRNAAELAAEKAAMLAVTGGSRLGRGRLAFQPSGPAAVGQTLG
jgi:hypothetical protein